MKLYQALAMELARWRNLSSDFTGSDAERDRRDKMADEVEDDINKFVKNTFPSGSGFDGGTLLDWEKTRENRIVLTTGFHHMNDGGYYDGWTYHDVVITPDLAYGYNIRVTGKNKRDIKDYILDVFGGIIGSDIEAGSISPGSISPVRSAAAAWVVNGV